MHKRVKKKNLWQRNRFRLIIMIVKPYNSTKKQENTLIYKNTQVKIKCRR